MPALASIPSHLLEYVVEQDVSLYTPMDHASWRFILKIARRFLGTHAHPIYLDGLAATGISAERIPTITEMDLALRRFGWRAVGVSGFIPPSVFMEMLSLAILPIACDMRQIEHLAYTPAPDIVHEAAGHAPIIADTAYADYLKMYGEVSRKAIYSKYDTDVYLAVRELSNVKEDPASTPADVARVQNALDHLIAQLPPDSEISEAGKLARMGWWTFEYGLIGDPKSPKIYGAGLLSSVGESYHCLSDDVKKIPFSGQCIDYGYDITKPQPQLFVARNFDELKASLEALASTLSYRRGGSLGLQRAKSAKEITTVVLDSGLQISGKLIDYRESATDSLEYLKYEGPVQLAQDDHEIEGQGVTVHASGYSSPLGRVKHQNSHEQWVQSSSLTESDWRLGKIEFESGAILTGRCIGVTPGLLVMFEDCTITQGDVVLYQPAWGRFDLALGSRAVSVFGGPADRSRWPSTVPRGRHRQKTNLTDQNRAINLLYARVRELREVPSGLRSDGIVDVLSNLHQLDGGQEDWLLHFECLELIKRSDPSPELDRWRNRIELHLTQMAKNSTELNELISRGLECLPTTEVS